MRKARPSPMVLRVDEAHGLLVAGLAEEALAGPEHDREDDQPQLVHQVVLDQRAPELIAGGDDDLSVELLLELRDLGHHVALDDRRVVPLGILEGRRHDVLGHAVQPVRELAAPGSPAQPEELVASPAEQPRLGAERLLERDLVPLLEVLAAELDEPAAEPEALLAVGVLDHAIERDVLRAAHHDPSHCRLLSSVFPVEASGASEIERRISGRPDVITCDACEREQR